MEALTDLRGRRQRRIGGRTDGTAVRHTGSTSRRSGAAPDRRPCYAFPVR